jgi:hypothetical protein
MAKAMMYHRPVTMPFHTSCCAERAAEIAFDIGNPLRWGIVVV